MSTTKNSYEDDIDFATLALQDEDFAKMWAATSLSSSYRALAIIKISLSSIKSVLPGEVWEEAAGLIYEETKVWNQMANSISVILSLSNNWPNLCWRGISNLKSHYLQTAYVHRWATPQHPWDWSGSTDFAQVPNRLKYLLWVQSLLDSTSDSYMEKYDPEREVSGLDIGTGASCIYPLLGCSQRSNWRFIGTGKQSCNFKVTFCLHHQQRSTRKVSNLLERTSRRMVYNIGSCLSMQSPVTN